MLVVLDTNVLVSAFWSKSSIPATVLGLALDGKVKPCFDDRILLEYWSVLMRPRFNFTEEEVRIVLQAIKETGISVLPEPLALKFTDDADRKFYEVAKSCDATLITGNLKHFPQEPHIVSPAEFLERYQ